MIDLEKYKDYAQSETPNKGLIADIIQEARGNRSAATYAADIGLNPTRISRVVNGNYANALDMDTLVKLADGNTEIFEKLLSANGMLSPAEQNRKNRHNNMIARMSMYHETEKKTNAIIVSELLSRGLSIKRIEEYLDTGRAIKPRLIYDSAYKVTDIDGNGIDWYFEVLSSLIHNEDDEENPCFAESRVLRAFDVRSQIFLTDAWYPERLNGRKFSFVFHDEWMMNKFESLIAKDKLNNKFSLVLVDIDASKVVKEVILNGDDDMHVFDRDVINTQQDEHFEYEFDVIDTDN